VASDLATLALNKGAEKRLRSGHLWVYSNEIDSRKTPLKNFTSGQLCHLQDSAGKTLGTVSVSPNNLICARLLSRTLKPLDKHFFKKVFKKAESLRDLVYSQPFYRLLYAEGDYLPGLVIDRFNDVFVVQMTTAAMESCREQIIAGLEMAFKPKGILLKNDVGSRSAEGLSEYVDVAYGTVPEFVPGEENSTRFMVPVINGQKTGWFYDHRENRRLLQQWVKGKTVLDVFSYVGAWGIEALSAGAESLTCIDSSEFALDVVDQNAELNGVADKVTAYEGNALDALKNLTAEKEKFDVVIMDPPAFIKKQKDKRKGEEAYHHYNQLALRLVKPGGILVSASCSMHLKHEELLNVVRVAGRHIDRQLQVFHQGGQGADHPVHPAIPETDYLKAIFSYVA